MLTVADWRSKVRPETVAEVERDIADTVEQLDRLHAAGLSAEALFEGFYATVSPSLVADLSRDHAIEMLKVLSDQIDQLKGTCRRSTAMI